MKRTFLLMAAVVLCTLQLSAQKSLDLNKLNPIIFEVFDRANINEQISQSPEKFLLMYYETVHTCEITQTLPAGTIVKGDYTQALKSGQRAEDPQKVVEKKCLNGWFYVFEQDENNYTAYIIGNTGYYAVVPSPKTYVRKRAEFMKQYGY